MSFALVLAPLLGFAVQELSCISNVDTDSAEKLLISFHLPENRQELPSEGTLRFPSEIGKTLDNETDVSLKLFHVPETDEDAAQGLVRYEARGEYSTFTVIIASDYFGKALQGISLDFEVRNLDDRVKGKQTLTCDAIISEI